MKVDLTIPSELKDIKLRDYQKYMKVVELNEDDESLLNIKAVEIFCHVKFKDVSGIKIKDFENIIETISGALTQDNEWHQKFKLGGINFGFIPNLEDMSIGEYIDLSNYLGDNDNLHKAMAVMYRPITQEASGMYLIEDYDGADKYCDIMKDVSLDILMGAQVFFYNLGKELSVHTMSSLMEEEENQSIQMKEILRENGDGMVQSMHLLEGMSMNLNLCLN